MNEKVRRPGCSGDSIAKLRGYENNHCLVAQARAHRFRDEATAARPISAQLLNDIERASWNCEKSQVVLFLAALGLLARRYGAQEALLIAIAAPKSTAGGEPDPLFLRLAVDESSSSDQYLQAIAGELDQARSHRDVSLLQVREELELETLEPLYRHLIGFRHDRWMTEIRDSPPFAFHFEVRRSDDAVHLLIQYDAARFAPEIIEQIATHYFRTLTFLLRNPGRKIAEFDLLLAAERHQIVVELNDTEVPRPEGLSLHGLFERQASLSPDAPAVICDRRAFTYDQVNRLANRLAHYLRNQLGVRAGQNVGLIVPRSERMIIGTLGILKSGAAYVPIDPAYPPEVVAATLEDAGIRTLLLDSDLLRNAGVFAGDLFFMDLQLQHLDTPEENPRVDLEETSAAYVIYTSGSTGKRKGVVVAHGAIANTILWRNELYGFGSQSITLQIPSYTFDSSVEDFFGMLTSGGALVLATEEQRSDSRSMKLLVERRGVTHFLITPSYHRAFLLELEPGPQTADLSSLTVVTIAGEEITPDLVRQHYQRLPGVLLINEYGPTENSVCSTACLLAPGCVTVPIGRPIANVSAFVLDSQLRVLPKGAKGELFVAGPGLARGYLNRQDLTAERFIPSPLRGQTGERLYRTGDLASWTGDGQLAFWGRADDQVKVRGFRIEPGEIEAVLRGHPRVADVAVVCQENEKSEKYLIAYLVGPKVPELAEIRTYLAARLPHFMVPDFFRTMDEIPVNAHGKIDRKLLMACDLFAAAERTEPTVETTPIEGALLGIWRETLGRRDLGMGHDFFENGGNSLSVLTILTKVRQVLKVELAIADLYTFSTVKKLALRIEGALAPGSGSNGIYEGR
jgi:bacitracin synthase 3